MKRKLKKYRQIGILGNIDKTRIFEKFGNMDKIEIFGKMDKIKIFKKNEKNWEISGKIQN